MLEPMPYRYLARPRVSPDEPHPEGVNCRCLVQDWFLERHGVFLPRDMVEQPGLWSQPQVPLAGADAAALAVLPEGSVVLAERTRSASGRPVDRSPGAFDNLEDYRLHLHTAVLLRRPDSALRRFAEPGQVWPPRGPVILHATAVAGRSCVWSPGRFLTHYRPVAVRHLVP